MISSTKLFVNRKFLSLDDVKRVAKFFRQHIILAPDLNVQGRKCYRVTAFTSAPLWKVEVKK